MYVCNVTKNALGLTGTTNPTQKELEAAVTATGYKGFISMEYEIQAKGETPAPDPDPDPIPDPEPDPDSGEGGGGDDVAASKTKKAKK